MEVERQVGVVDDGAGMGSSVRSLETEEDLIESTFYVRVCQLALPPDCRLGVPEREKTIAYSTFLSCGSG